MSLRSHNLQSRRSGQCCLHLFESAVKVELPPVQMVRVEAEVVILAAVTGVGQNVAATFGEAQEDVSAGR